MIAYIREDGTKGKINCMDSKFLIVANWKANKTVGQAKQWLKQLYTHWSEIEQTQQQVEIVFACPYTLLHFFDATHNTIIIASQDISIYDAGAYTGEVPGELLKDLNVHYCLIGHSERRKYFQETTETVGEKLDQSIKNEIIPIICAQTLEEIPENVRNYPSDKYIIMYEPFEAISTNGQYHPESAEQVQETLANWRAKLPSGVRILYGGSVNAKNARSLLSTAVDGFVTGHASLDAEEFFDIIKQCRTPSTSL